MRQRLAGLSGGAGLLVGECLMRRQARLHTAGPPRPASELMGRDAARARTIGRAHAYCSDTRFCTCRIGVKSWPDTFVSELRRTGVTLRSSVWVLFRCMAKTPPSSRSVQVSSLPVSYD